MCFGRVTNDTGKVMAEVMDSIDNIMTFAKQAGFADSFPWATFIPSVRRKYSLWVYCSSSHRTSWANSVHSRITMALLFGSGSWRRRIVWYDSSRSRWLPMNQSLGCPTHIPTCVTNWRTAGPSRRPYVPLHPPGWFSSHNFVLYFECPCFSLDRDPML